MAFLLGRAFARRILNSSKSHFPPQTQCTHSSSSSPSLFRRIPPGFEFRNRPVFGTRVGLEGIWWNPKPDKELSEKGLSVEEVRKVLKASEMETARSMLKATRAQSINYEEYFRICCEASHTEHGEGIASSLDESGDVVVLSDVVFLYPTQVAKAMERALPLLSTREEYFPAEEFARMEMKKVEIDVKAAALVRRELLCGLGLVTLQTLGFARLTFWELSWDVMEPICFFVTSLYFIASYAFFLRTSEEPSFEGLFRRRLQVKQKRLMKKYGFDIRRFEELKRARQSSPEEYSSSLLLRKSRRRMSTIRARVVR